jgi:molecular chaperone GrpE (heat shock protein)
MDTNETDSKTDQETTEFKPYDEQDVFILEQKNAGNISYLKERVEATQDLTGEVKDLKKTVSELQDQMTELVAAQQQYAQRMTGGTTPEITGALPEK